MDKKRLNSEDLKGQNPFRVPEGYMEGLTNRIMSQLPEKSTHRVQARKVSLIVRLRPWISVAAAIIAIGFFINIFIDIDKEGGIQPSDSVWMKTQIPPDAVSQIPGDDEYLEYLEVLYSDYILEEEMAYSE